MVCGSIKGYLINTANKQLDMSPTRTEKKLHGRKRNMAIESSTKVPPKDAKLVSNDDKSKDVTESSHKKDMHTSK